MSRRRSTPWIHRWSRAILGAIAICGALITGYLTAVKFSGGPVACPTEGCSVVLSSPYANVFGIPLTLFGFLAYASMAVFALLPLAVKAEGNKDLRANLEKWTWLLLLAGATSMTVFSGYLMYLLAFKIKAVCIYCVASALCSLGLFIVTLIGRAWEDVGQIFFTAIVVGMVTLIGTLGLYASVNAPTADTLSTKAPPITTTSGSAELALANHLKQKGAKMYGAFWCPHCHDQKQLFGKEAFSQITYVECADPQNPQQQVEACRQAGVQGYPTWEIDGKLVESGSKSLEQLADLSGYRGSRNFQNKLPGS